jgi:hypothetical protein
MFDTLLVKHTTRLNESFGMTYWAPMLPSTQFDTITWATGETERVARVNFPDNAPIEIVFFGDADDAARPKYLDHGWRILGP